MAEVFINYRTGDGDEAAEFLASRLSDRFGKEHIFKASHSIQPGESFPKALIDAAQKSNVLLAVMGPDWGAAPSCVRKPTGCGRRSSRPRHAVPGWSR